MNICDTFVSVGKYLANVHNLFQNAIIIGFFVETVTDLVLLILFKKQIYIAHNDMS